MATLKKLPHAAPNAKATAPTNQDGTSEASTSTRVA
jgi:hypothetical protein